MELKKDQRKAVESSQPSIVVSAGAGTGKTAVLVSRFVRLVRSASASVNQILTITFTDKAAEEMKQRIAEEFRKLGMRNERTAVETSYISTIHSFCSRLIRENPFEAEVDPAFEVMDEVDQTLMRGECFESLFSEGDSGFLELAENYNEKHLRAGITGYMDLCRSLGRELKDVEELLAHPETLTEKAQEVADRRAEKALWIIRESLQALSTLEARGSCEDRRQEILQLRDSISDVNSLRVGAKMLEEIAKRPARLPQKGNGREACEEVRKHLRCIKETLRSEEAAIHFDKDAEASLLPTKVALLKGVVLLWARYDRNKSENGLLDYEDLQLIARRLLRDNPELHREYSRRFRHVMVDEFQDINGLQKELIDLISQDANLFVVGDTRQSIYGFRNADAEIFTNLVQELHSSPKMGSEVYLGDNFRSAQNLIHFFNFFFSKLWSGDDMPFHTLHFARRGGEEPGIPSVEIIFSRKDSDSGETPDGSPSEKKTPENAQALRRKEAQTVASRVRKLVENQEIRILDPLTDEIRPVTFGDVAILCRARGSYPSYTEALARLRVPFCTDGGQDFYDKQEIADVMNLLRVIDNPLRDIPLVAVLRSPFVGVSDEVLLRLRNHAEKDRLSSPYVMRAIRQSLRIPGLSDEAKRKLSRFEQLLETLRARKDSLPLHQLAKLALDATPYLTRVLARPNGAQKVANVSKFINTIRGYEREHPGGISGFLTFFDLLKSQAPREKESPLEMFSGDVVKLMTIHTAKGLEFPVVVLADMSRRFNFDSDTFPPSREMEIACKPWQDSSEDSLGRKLVLSEQRERQLAEEKRLLYVAMTRARDYLILAGNAKLNKKTDTSKQTCPVDWLLPIVEQETSFPQAGGFCDAQLGDAVVRISMASEEEESSDHTPEESLLKRYCDRIAAGETIPIAQQPSERLLPEVRRHIERISSQQAVEPFSPPAEISVSQLLLFEECPQKYFLEAVMKLPTRDVMESLGLYSPGKPTGAANSSGLQRHLPQGTDRRRFGEMIHACLEQYDFHRGDPQDLAEITGRVFSSPEEGRAAEELIHLFLQSEEARLLRNARELYREIPAKALLNHTVINGIIDVLYLDEGERWTILDFKTGLMRPEDIRQHSLYDLQMLLYAFLVREATGSVPQKAVLCFLGSGDSRSIITTSSEIERTRERAAEIITSIGRREFAVAGGAPCGQCEFSCVCSDPCAIGEGRI